MASIPSLKLISMAVVTATASRRLLNVDVDSFRLEHIRQQRLTGDYTKPEVNFVTSNSSRNGFYSSSQYGFSKSTANSNSASMDRPGRAKVLWLIKTAVTHCMCVSWLMALPSRTRWTPLISPLIASHPTSPPSLQHSVTVSLVPINQQQLSPVQQKR